MTCLEQLPESRPAFSKLPRSKIIGLPMSQAPVVSAYANPPFLAQVAVALVSQPRVASAGEPACHHLRVTRHCEPPLESRLAPLGLPAMSRHLKTISEKPWSLQAADLVLVLAQCSGSAVFCQEPPAPLHHGLEFTYPRLVQTRTDLAMAHLATTVEPLTFRVTSEDGSRRG